MTLKLHGFPSSLTTQKVLVLLVEKKIKFEFVLVDFKTGEQRKAPHLAIHPFGKTPVLEDDGYFVYESRAICKYIALKYAEKGAKLIPALEDLQAYGLFEQACSLEVNLFDVPCFGLLWEEVFKPRKGLGAPDTAIVKKNLDQLDTNFAVYDQILSKQKYLAGDEISLADLFHLPHAEMGWERGLKEVVERYPRLTIWFEGLRQRESWKFVLANPTGMVAEGQLDK